MMLDIRINEIECRQTGLEHARGAANARRRFGAEALATLIVEHRYRRPNSQSGRIGFPLMARVLWSNPATLAEPLTHVALRPIVLRPVGSWRRTRRVRAAIRSIFSRSVSTEATFLCGECLEQIEDAEERAGMMITAAQCRTARTLLGWSLQKLSSAASVPESVIDDLELERRHPEAAALDGIRRAFEEVGVVFLRGDDVRRRSEALAAQ